MPLQTQKLSPNSCDHERDRLHSPANHIAERAAGLIGTPGPHTAIHPTGAPHSIANDADADTWELCKTYFSKAITGAFYSKFIEPLQVVAARDEAHELILCAPDAKHKKHVEQRYLQLIREQLAKISGRSVAVRICLPDEFAGVRLSPRGPVRLRSSFPSQVNPADRQTAAQIQEQAGFHLPGHEPAAVNRHDLDRLWQGAFHAGCLMITGPSGSGKTSIARAFARLQQQREIATRYMTAEEFLTEFSLACRKRENITWRQSLRANRVLIIDDFQFIKPQALRSQEELQYLVDEFQETGHLLILCSDRDANEQGLTPALLSRLQAGHRIQLVYPAHTERETILSEAAQELDLAREHITYLAGRIQRDMRHLKSAIRRLAQGRQMKSAEARGWSAPELDQLCADLYTRRPEVAPARVREVVAEFFQLTPEAITGPVRDKQHSLARHLTAYLCTEHLQLNLKETAAVIGRREHGSVIHARKKIEEYLERDLFFRKQLQDLTERIFSV